MIPPEVVKQLQVQMRKPGRAGGQIPPYIVPLSVQALEIVRYMLDQVLPAQRFLFSHRSNLQLRISENTLNNALHRIGLADQLTGHGMRATISTALHEIGYPKSWIDAQLSHADPDQVSAAYNHARYVEQRRTMMQDWANRLDLWAQGKHEAASSPLTIRLEGAVSLTEAVGAVTASLIYEIESKPKGVVHVDKGIVATAVMPDKGEKSQPVSEIQRQRLAMLTAYEAPTNLTVPEFARLAGVSKAQVGQEIKAGRLLAIGLGNRGLRVPDWQLDPSQLIKTQAALMLGKEAWEAYWRLSDKLKTF